MTALNYKLKQVIIIYFSQNLKSQSFALYSDPAPANFHLWSLLCSHKHPQVEDCSFNNLADALTPPADLVW